MHEVVREKGECVSAPLPTVSCAYSSVGASQVPPTRILLMHSAYASREPEEQVQRPLGSATNLSPLFLLCTSKSLYGCFRAFESSGGLVAREVRQLGCRVRGQEGYARVSRQ